ncbi:MAG: endonuclease/exonuclease/phosphatase family protein [Gemmataceae bacterium]|nr:endonuclease/exonuclease/phosphatase family protein [Gemmataceae bacterium]
MRTLFLAALLLAGCNKGRGPDLSGYDDPKDAKAARPKGGLRQPRELAADGAAREVFFCFWNVENLFDDVDDKRGKRGDEIYDPWFAKNEEAREIKYDRVASVLARMNGGKGPDIIALAEVESRRACELLVKAINAKLDDPKLHYVTIVFEDFGGGRDIGTPVITRLPVGSKRGKVLGNRMRIMETHVVVNGHDLAVIASHWSSRISDKTGATRGKYADQIHGRFRAMLKADPRAALVVCGDFNDEPDEPSVAKHLKAVKDIDAVRKGDEPLLWHALWKQFEAGEGTHFYRKMHLFDHLCLSPGLLGGGSWEAVEGSAAIVPEIADDKGRPNRFGGPSDKRAYSRRGASDHFPVTIKLKVAAAK